MVVLAGKDVEYEGFVASGIIDQEPGFPVGELNHWYVKPVVTDAPTSDTKKLEPGHGGLGLTVAVPAAGVPVQGTGGEKIYALLAPGHVAFAFSTVEVLTA